MSKGEIDAREPAGSKALIWRDGVGNRNGGEGWEQMGAGGSPEEGMG